jgi:hypothetical protein
MIYLRCRLITSWTFLSVGLARAGILSFEVSRIILFIHVFCKFIPVQVLPTSSLPLSQVSVGAGLLNVVGMEHAPRLAVVPSGTSNLIAAVLLPVAVTETEQSICLFVHGWYYTLSVGHTTARFHSSSDSVIVVECRIVFRSLGVWLGLFWLPASPYIH